MRPLRLGFVAALLCVTTLLAARSAWPGVGAIRNPEERNAVLRVLVLIDRGGPYQSPRDGSVFGNFERLLPRERRGYYREYTVPTPGVRSRGARRIIAGERGEAYYTRDHYRTFQRLD